MSLLKREKRCQLSARRAAMGKDRPETRMDKGRECSFVSAFHSRPARALSVCGRPRSSSGLIGRDAVAQFFPQPLDLIELGTNAVEERRLRSDPLLDQKGGGIGPVLEDPGRNQRV